MYYIVYDLDYLQGMANNIRSNAGTIFDVALWAFLLVLGIYVVIDIVDKFGR